MFRSPAWWFSLSSRCMRPGPVIEPAWFERLRPRCRDCAPCAIARLVRARTPAGCDRPRHLPPASIGERWCECVSRKRHERKTNCGYPTVADILHLALHFLFGCWHRNLSRPFTLSGWTYEVCLNCGKKFSYDRADIGRNVRQRKEEGTRSCREVSDKDYATFGRPTDGRVISVIEIGGADEDSTGNKHGKGRV